MKTAPPPLLPVFRSRLVGDVLALVLLDPARTWTAEELAARTHGSYPSITRELRRLVEAGLLEAEVVGRTRLVRANQASPYFDALTTLVAISFGPPLIIAEEFADVPGIEDLMIFGSWAARASGEPGPAPNDVDVLVLGGPDRDAVYDAATRAEWRLGRQVNTAIRTTEQWETATDGFARQVRASPIIGVPGPWRPEVRGSDAEMEEGPGNGGPTPGRETSRTRARRR